MILILYNLELIFRNLKEKKVEFGGFFIISVCLFTNTNLFIFLKLVIKIIF
jgi:hypothetical protein